MGGIGSPSSCTASTKGDVESGVVESNGERRIAKNSLSIRGRRVTGLEGFPNHQVIINDAIEQRRVVEVGHTCKNRVCRNQGGQGDQFLRDIWISLLFSALRPAEDDIPWAEARSLVSHLEGPWLLSHTTKGSGA